MTTIGFRAENDTIHYGVVEGTKQTPILVSEDKFSAPVTYSDGEAMAYYRDRVRSVLDKHKPQAAFVRFGETFFVRKPSTVLLTSLFARARIEGVILEAAHSLGVPIVGASLSGISTSLGSKRAKAYLEAGELRGVDLKGRPEPRREAILVAVAALEK